MAELTLDQLNQALDHGFEKQAVIINAAFQGQQDHFDKLINDVKEDLKGDILRVETKVDRALYTELTHLEARVTRLEQKSGISPA
jgi:SMC interacting uncharacterized protein involved in chromosome segregation